MSQVTIHTLAALPSTDVSTLAKGTDYLFVITRASLRVRLKVRRRRRDLCQRATLSPFRVNGSAVRGDGDDPPTAPLHCAERQAQRLGGYAVPLRWRVGPVILVKEAGNGVGVARSHWLSGYLRRRGPARERHPHRKSGSAFATPSRLLFGDAMEAQTSSSGDISPHPDRQQRGSDRSRRRIAIDAFSCRLRC